MAASRGRHLSSQDPSPAYNTSPDPHPAQGIAPSPAVATFGRAWAPYPSLDPLHNVTGTPGADLAPALLPSHVWELQPSQVVGLSSHGNLQVARATKW